MPKTKNTKTKKYLIVALIPIILVSTLFPLFDLRAEEKNTENKLDGLDFIAGWFGDGVLDLVSILTAMMGMVMEASINYSIINTEFYDMETVRQGWRVSRDLANMFFIFILLYIGLSMILQLSGVNTKKMLISVIIIALLVNFSFPFTRIIIDATNLFAMEFLCALTDEQCNAALISNVFQNGLQTHTIHKNAAATGSMKIAITTLLGSVFLIIAAFIFLAIAIVFVVRTVVLIILLIFSPLAYLAMILPATSSFAKQWWTQLLKQAITAPAIMFMLYLTGMMIHFGLPAVLESQNLSFWTILTNRTEALRSGINIVLQFFIVSAMLVGSIMVAQNIGAYGASGAIEFAHATRKRATGYAGKINRRYGTGKAAQKVIDTKTAQKLARIPVLGKSVRPLAKISEKRREDYAKQAGKYTKMAPSELAVTLPGLGPEIRKSVVSSLNDEKMSKMAKTMDTKGQVSFGKRLMKQDKALGEKFAKATRNPEAGAQILQVEGESLKDASKKYTESLNMAQRKEIDISELGKNKEVFEGYMDAQSGKDFEQVTRASRKNITSTAQALDDYAKSTGKSLEQLPEEIRSINSEISTFLSAGMGRHLLDKETDIKERGKQIRTEAEGGKKKEKKEEKEEEKTKPEE